jgi:tetratricopeptide (TPR) repeat protein
MLGQTVSHYRIISKIGQGGMGVVYKAEDTKIRRTVALKFLPEGLTQAPEAKERFIHEARSAGQLDHPNICTIHEVGETEDGQLFIVMAYYDGMTLNEKISSGALSAAEVLNLAAQIAAGLDNAHQAGMVHRDIKPANILITSDDLVKIVDFGLAKLSDQTKMTRTGTTLGTASYMAPEQASGAVADHRADIWALAVVIYEMFTGKVPFEGDFLPAVVYAIVHSVPEAPSTLRHDLDPDFDQVFIKGFAKDPDERFQSAGELVAALGVDVGSGSGSPARFPMSRPAGSGQVRIPPLSRKLVYALVFLAGLTAAILGGRSLLQTTPLAHLEPTPEGRRSLIILPFAFQGDEAERHLAGQFSNLLADRLEWVGDLHVVAGDTLGACLTEREKSGLGSRDLAPVATRLEADLVIGGKVTTLHGNLQVDLHFANRNFAFQTINGEPTPLELILDHADQMALMSIPSVLPGPRFQSSRMVAATSDNLIAVKSFIRAEGYRRKFAFNGWQLNLSASLEADSTMAMAHYSRYEFERWFDNRKEMQTALDAALKHSHTLPPEGQDLIQAAGFYMAGNIDKAENLLNRILLNNRNYLEAWYMLTSIGWDSNFFRGRSLTHTRVAFERIWELDPGAELPGVYLQFVYAMEGDIEAMENLFLKVDGPTLSPTSRGQLAYMTSDMEIQTALADSINPVSLLISQALILSFPDNHKNSVRFLADIQPRISGSTALGWISETQAHLEAASGHWTAARDSFAAMPDQMHPWRLTYESIVTSMPFTRATPEEIRDLIARVNQWRPLANYSIDKDNYGLIGDRYSPDFALHPHYKEFSLCLLNIRLGDHAAAGLALQRLEALPLPPENEPIVDEMIISVRGWMAFERGDFEEVLTILADARQRALPNMLYSGFQDRTFQRYLRALTLEKVGRYEEAVPWFEYIGEKTERSIPYESPARLRLGRIYEKMGDSEAAVANYRSFIKAYQTCDERYLPLLEEAQSRVAALTGDS